MFLIFIKVATYNYDAVCSDTGMAFYKSPAKDALFAYVHSICQDSYCIRFVFAINFESYQANIDIKIE
jgi:hypothetical protein